MNIKGILLNLMSLMNTFRKRFNDVDLGPKNAPFTTFWTIFLHENGLPFLYIYSALASSEKIRTK